MKIALIPGALIGLTMLLGNAGTARADDDEVAFHMHNYLDKEIGVWVASEKSTSANPWAHITVDAGKDGTIRLKSPDRFVIAVDVGKQRSRSKPIAIKAFLAKHPDYVLNLSAEKTFGKAFGQSNESEDSGSDEILQFSLGPKDVSSNNNSTESKKPVEVPDLGFEQVSQDGQ
jgi:hypothetical protein